VQFATHDQYAGLFDAQGSTAAEQQTEIARQEKLGSLAQAVIGSLQDEALNLRGLASAVSSAASGRHILLWSDQASAESAWRETGVSGRLQRDSTMVSVINRGGNKLDQYVSVGVHAQLAPRGGRTAATLTVTVDNRTPGGQSQYIAGPYPGLGTSYGEYVGVLAVNLPTGAQKPRLEGSSQIVAEGPEGPTWLIAGVIDVPAGASRQYVLRFTLPGGPGRMTVLPSARIPSVSWSYSGGDRTDSSPFTISW
jgi:hypothetical protein